MPYSDSEFDAYFSHGVVEHIDKGPETAIEEAWRVLKPNGVIIISVPIYSLVRSIGTLFLKLKYLLWPNNTIRTILRKEKVKYNRKDEKSYLEEFKKVQRTDFKIKFSLYPDLGK